MKPATVEDSAREIQLVVAVNLLALITLHYETRHGVSTVFRECREVERPVPVRESQPDGVNMSRTKTH
jgi:hypothetical protein